MRAMKPAELSKALDGLLARLNFQRHGISWVRSRGPFSDLINLQRSKSLDEVTVNVGLMHAPTYEMAWGEAPTYPISEPECIVRTRLGFLMNGRDHWWALDEPTAVASVVQALTSAALPFISGFNDLKDVERWLGSLPSNRYPPEALYLAAVKHQRGKREEAIEAVERLARRLTSGAWSERISKMGALLE